MPDDYGVLSEMRGHSFASLGESDGHWQCGAANFVARLLLQLENEKSRGESIMNVSRKLGSTLGALCLGLVCALPAAAHDDGGLFDQQIAWWQWTVSVPAATNPQLDQTGDYCGVGQRGDYWYLTGNTGGETTRSCTVPKGVKLLVPIVVTFCYPEEGFDDDASCIAYVNDFIGSYRPKDLVLRLDGEHQEIRDVCELTVARGDDVSGVPEFCRINRRADRTLFTFAIGPDTILFSSPGLWRANAARGYWGVIDTSRLALGKHVLKLKANGLFTLSVTYKLTVAKPTN